MLLGLYGGNYSYWNLYHKVTFDGPNKLITVNPGEAIVNVKDDIYSSWKEWVMLEDYSKYDAALRTIGGDSVGGGLYAGDMYFTINGWRIVINEAVTINGIIYSDDYSTPFVINASGGVINRVSNLAYAYNTTGVEAPTVTQIRQEIDANSTQLAAIKVKTDTITNAPTAAQVAAQVRVELTAELAHLMALQNGLTNTQATMLQEIYRLYGLDPTKPLVVTNTSRSAGAEVQQQIVTDTNSTTVTRI